MNLLTQFYNQNQGIMLTLDDNDIIRYKLSSPNVVSDNLFQYTVQPYQFTVKYSSLKGTYILDQYNCPIPLDQHQILNKYMIYYISTPLSKKQALYILQDTIQYSNQTNQFSFKAVPMIGVIIKYDKQKPTTIINNTQYNVPRNMMFTSSYTGSQYRYDSPI